MKIKTKKTISVSVSEAFLSFSVSKSQLFKEKENKIQLFPLARARE